jgi:hypothetical protein
MSDRPNSCLVPTPAPSTEATIYRNMRDLMIKAHCRQGPTVSISEIFLSPCEPTNVAGHPRAALCLPPDPTHEVGLH